MRGTLMAANDAVLAELKRLATRIEGEGGITTVAQKVGAGGTASGRRTTVPTPLPHLLLIALLWLWLGLGWAVEGHAQELPTFEVIAKDGRLFPERLEVPAGQRVKLVVKNQGKGPIEFENLDMRVEKVLAPGATSFVVLPKMKPGEYEFIDEFHMDAGKMRVVAK